MYVRLDDLPEDLRQTLGELSRGVGREGHGALVLEGTKFKVLRILLGALVLGGSFAYVSSESWLLRGDELTAHHVLCVVGSALLLSGLASLVGLLRSDPRPAIVHNGRTVAVTGRGGAPVWIRRVADLKDKDHGGLIRHKITLDAGDERQVVRSDNSKAYSYWASIPMQPVADAPPEQDWVARLEEAGVPDAGRPSRVVPTLGYLGALLVLAYGLGTGVASLARVRNLVAAEAQQWSSIPRTQDMEEPYHRNALKDYVKWAGIYDHRVLEELYDLEVVEGAEEAIRVEEELPWSQRDLKKLERLRELDGIRWRWQRARNHPVGDLLRAHTPFEKHWRQALRAYDAALFEEAREAGTATALREFLRDWPRSAHRDAAREALREMYRQAEERYRTHAAASGADEEAVAAMRALLAYLRQHDPEEPRIPVCFFPVQGLEGGLVERLVEQFTGSPHVHEVGPSFSTENNQRRETSVVRHMSQAFRWAVGDLFVFRKGELAASRDTPRILVRYEVRGTGVPYSKVSEKSKPADQRHYYVGIAVDFSFTVQVPSPGEELADDPASGFRFAVQATPAPNFKAASRAAGEEAFARAVYDAMAQTAFRDAARQVSEDLGLARDEPGEG